MPRSVAWGLLAAVLLLSGAAFAGASLGWFDTPTYGIPQPIPFVTGALQARADGAVQFVPALRATPLPNGVHSGGATPDLAAPFILETAVRFEPGSSPNASWLLSIKGPLRHIEIAIFNDGTYSILDQALGLADRAPTTIQRVDFPHLRAAGSVNRLRFEAFAIGAPGTGGGWALRINDEIAYQHPVDADPPLDGALQIDLQAPRSGAAAAEMIALTLRKPGPP
jgi:hypothetical protein